jgi:tripartite-type tricarboxylate transporter receptor subunit TctC
MQEGTLRGLAVTSLQRDALAPDLPTMQESGLDGFEVVSWTGLYAPAGTPSEAIDKMNAAMAAVAQLDEIKQIAEKRGVTLESTTPEEAAASQKAVVDRLKPLAKELGLSLDVD